MDRRITIKFWQVSDNEDGIAFADALSAIIALPQDERTCELDENPYQVEASADNKGTIFVGEVIRLQDQALPTRVKRGQKARSLDLDVDEYLGYHTGFIYEPRTELLGVEIRPAAAGFYRLVRAIKEISKTNSDFPVWQVLEHESLDKLASSKNGTFLFKIADPASLVTHDPELEEFRDSIEHLKDLVNGAYINVSIGVGQRINGLKTSRVKKCVKWLLGERAHDRGGVRTVRVIQPNEAQPIVDFISAQVRVSEVIDFSRDIEKNWKKREALLKQALNKARQYVESE